MARRLCLNLSRQTLASSDDLDVWDSGEIVRRLKGAAGLAALLRYGDVRLRVDDIDELLSSRPLIAARLVSHGRARIEEASGRTRPIGWFDLLRVVGADVAGAAAWPAMQQRILADIASIEPVRKLAPARGEGVLALRTDLWFGLEAGGALAHSVGLFNALAARERVRLITSHNLPLSASVEQVQPGRAKRWPRTECSLLAYNRDLIAAAQGAPQPRFVYQRHGLYGYAGALIAQRRGAPLVLEYNGSEVWIGDHWGAPIAARDTALDIEHRMLGAAHLVTVVSKPLIEQAVDRGAPRERVLLLPNAVDADQYHPNIDGAGARARYGLGDAIVVGFIGTFGRWHGARLLAEAFAEACARAPDAKLKLLMVGDGLELPAVRAIVAAAGLSERAVFTGFVPQKEGPAHLAAADILVTPTLPNPDGTEFFGSPTKLFEYMAMGRAIISSDMAQMADVLRQEKTALLTTPGDKAALAGAVLRLAGDEALRRTLADAARAEAVARHTWTHRADELLRAIAELT